MIGIETFNKLDIMCGCMCSLLLLVFSTLSGTSVLLDGFLDNTDGNSLFHVSDGESSEWWVLIESFNTHGFLGEHSNESGITRLDELGFGFNNLTSSSVDLGFDFVEFASDVSGVAIENWGVSLLDLTWMVQDDDLSEEVSGILSGVVLGVGGNESSSDILDGQVLHVETNIVTGFGFSELLVMHFNGLALGGDTEGSEGEDHTGSEDSSFDSTDWDSSNTTDLVDVLEWESEGLILGSLGGFQFIESTDEGGTRVPFHVV